MGISMLGISWKLEKYDTQSLHGKLKNDTSLDFSSKSQLKEFVQHRLNKLSCPECGGQRIKGKDIKIDYRKIKFYDQVKKEGLFGREKIVDVHNKNVWRIEDAYSYGGLTCKSCKKSGSLNASIDDFHDVTLATANNLLSMLYRAYKDNISKEIITNFVENELSYEAMNKPLKIKRLIFLCKDKLDSVNHEDRNAYASAFTSLGVVSFEVLDHSDISKLGM